MTSDERSHDTVLAAVARLGTWDIDRARAERLRGRCHRALRSYEPRASSHAPVDRRLWRQVALPIFAGAWSAIYLFEIIRRAAAIYGF